MEIITYILIAILAIAGSYAHGRGDDLDGDPDKSWYESKGVYMAIQTSAFAALGYFAIGLYGLAATLIVPFNWFVIRNSTEASATLDYIDDVLAASKKRLLTAHIDSTAICALALGVSATQSLNLLWWLIPLLISAALCAVVPIALGQGWKTKKQRARKRAITEIFGVGIHAATCSCALFSCLTVWL